MMNIFARHLADQPQLETPSFGRRALAGLAGGLTALGSGAQAGMGVTDFALNNRNRDRMNRWMARGKTMSEFGEVATRGEEARTRRFEAGDRAAYRGRMAGAAESRAETYRTRQTGRVGPKKAVPVGQVSEANQLAIEEILSEDPSATKFFDKTTDKNGTPTFSYRTDVKGKLFGTRSFSKEEIAHLEQIKKRIKKKAKELMSSTVDVYDRSDEDYPDFDQVDEDYDY